MKNLLAIACVIAFSSLLHAQLPKTLSFQGYLTNDAGEPIDESGLSVSFELYTSLAGGTAIWGPQPKTIDVDKGIFTTTLGGDDTPLNLNFDQPYFLQITIAGEALSRIPVTAGMYSLSTLNASNISSGTVALSRGGTGANDAATARTNLGLGSLATQNSGSVSITGGSVSGITDLAIADGGTGAGTVVDARTNLGLVIGTNVQAYDADLTTYSGITPSTDIQTLLGSANNTAILSNLGIGTIASQDASSVSISGGTLSGITDLAIADGGTGAGTAVDARINLGLAIGTNVQAYDSDLTTFAGISPTTDVQTMLGSANNAGIRSNIGLGSIATQDANSVSISGGSITGITALAITEGGTGAGTAAGARTNLELVVGADVQAYDPDLDDLADGSLTGSKVGSGIDAANLTGTINDARLESTVDLTRLNTSGGIHVGGTSDPGADNMIVDGTLGVGGTPSTTFEVTHGSDGPASGDGLSVTSGSDTWTFFSFATSNNLLLYYNNSLRGTFSGSTGIYSESSDIKLKKNLEPLNPVLGQLIKIPVWRYHFNHQSDSEEKEIGVIAQEIIKLFPSLVEYSENEDLYTVNYAGLAPLAIKAIQEQQQLIDSLASEVTNLKKKLEKSQQNQETLEAKVSEQDKKINQLIQFVENFRTQGYSPVSTSSDR